MKLAKFVSIACTLVTVAAYCASWGMMSVASQDGEVQALEAFLRQELGPPNASDNTEYVHSRVDLDGDNTDEIVVFLMGSRWCGTGGCRMLVIQQSGAVFRVVTATTVTREPIRVLESESNGWKDLAVYVGGGGISPGYDVRLRFDGNSYPTNPTVVSQEGALPDGEVLIPPVVPGDGRRLWSDFN